MKFHIGRPLAVKKEQRAATQPEAMARRTGRCLNLDDGGLVDANHAAVGKLQGRPAVCGGAQAVAGMQQLIGARQPPVVGVGGGDLDRSGKFDEPAGAIGVGLGERRRPGAGEGNRRAKRHARQRPAKRAGRADDKSF